MTRPDPSALAAAADQHVQETLEMLRGMARQHAGQSQNAAATELEQTLLDMVEPRVLANTLANVLLDQVRLTETDATLAQLVDGTELSGVEVRLIGPPASVRAVLAKMTAAGIPAFDTSDEKDAYQRPDTIRLLSYTDGETRAVCRRRRNITHRRGTGRAEQ